MCLLRSLSRHHPLEREADIQPCKLRSNTEANLSIKKDKGIRELFVADNDKDNVKYTCTKHIDTGMKHIFCIT